MQPGDPSARPAQGQPGFTGGPGHQGPPPGGPFDQPTMNIAPPQGQPPHAGQPGPGQPQPGPGPHGPVGQAHGHHAQYGPGNGPTGASRAATFAVVAQALCPVLVILGLSIPENDTMLWADATAWSVFAAAASVAQLAPALGRNNNRPVERTWTIGAIATAALLAFWVLIVLPGVGSNVGFVLTMGAAAATIGCWLSPGRRL